MGKQGIYFKKICTYEKRVRGIKKYLVFLLSFAAFYVIVQIATGLVLTVSHTPDPYSTGGNSASEAVFGQALSPVSLVLFTLLPATFAYFLSQKIGKPSSE